MIIIHKHNTYTLYKSEMEIVVTGWLRNGLTDSADFFFCVCKYQGQVNMKEHFRKTHRKVGNLDGKNTIVVPSVQ